MFMGWNRVVRVVLCWMQEWRKFWCAGLHDVSQYLVWHYQPDRIFPTWDDSKKTIKCFKTKQLVKYSQQGFLRPGLLHLETIIFLEEGGFSEYDAQIGRRNLLSWDQILIYSSSVSRLNRLQALNAGEEKWEKIYVVCLKLKSAFAICFRI
jgi:hypothetical protein